MFEKKVEEFWLFQASRNVVHLPPPPGCLFIFLQIQSPACVRARTCVRVRVLVCSHMLGRECVNTCRNIQHQTHKDAYLFICIGQACPSRTHIIACMHARTHSQAMREHPVPRAHTSSTRAGRRSRSTLWWDSWGFSGSRARCSRTPRCHNQIGIDHHEHAHTSLRPGLAHAAAPPRTARRGGTAPAPPRPRRAFSVKFAPRHELNRPHARFLQAPCSPRCMGCQPGDASKAPADATFMHGCSSGSRRTHPSTTLQRAS